jgi:hypothetical protein
VLILQLAIRISNKHVDKRNWINDDDDDDDDDDDNAWKLETA